MLFSVEFKLLFVDVFELLVVLVLFELFDVLVVFEVLLTFEELDEFDVLLELLEVLEVLLDVLVLFVVFPPPAASKHCELLYTQDTHEEFVHGAAFGPVPFTSPIPAGKLPG